jgi:hypothetical protein
MLYQTTFYDTNIIQPSFNASHDYNSLQEFGADPSA